MKGHAADCKRYVTPFSIDSECAMIDKVHGREPARPRCAFLLPIGAGWCKSIITMRNIFFVLILACFSLSPMLSQAESATNPARGSTVQTSNAKGRHHGSSGK